MKFARFLALRRGLLHHSRKGQPAGELQQNDEALICVFTALCVIDRYCIKRYSARLFNHIKVLYKALFKNIRPEPEQIPF